MLYPGPGMGLFDVNDQLGSLSYDRSSILQTSPFFLLLFGVDRASVGAVPPDPELVSLGRPFNVFDQAERHQQAGDLYLSTGAFDVNGPIQPKDGGGRSGQGNNTLGINQGDTGGDDMDLGPAKAPVQSVPPSTSQDNSTDSAYPPAGAKDRVHRIFFSVTADSPSLPFFPGPPSGANIYSDADPSDPSNPIELFASASSLGLQLADELDALVVLLNPDSTFEVLFSLTRNSPTLPLRQLSAADVLVSHGNGTFDLYAPALFLGLDPVADNLDSLELIPCQYPPLNDLILHAIFLVWPGDFDRSGTLTPSDAAAYAGCYSGPGVSYDTNGTATYTVQIEPGPVFNPSDITIEIGDIVQWVWMPGSGLNNVVSGTNGTPDGVFYSGPPVPPPFTFQVAFTPTLVDVFPKGGGVYHYFSQTDPTSAVGSITVLPHPCATFDLDFDGDVDCEDWVEFLPVYAEATGGGHPMPLSVPEFVAALLGNPALPGHLCIADVNLDGTVDGRDIQPYVDLVLGP